MDEKKKLDGYSGLTTNGLLSESSLDIISSGYTFGYEGDTELINKKRNIYKNVIVPKSQKKIIKEIVLKEEERNKLSMKKQYSTLNRIDSFFEKNIFNKLYSIDKIMYNMEINEENARKMVNKKVGL
ncbi:hypothetical protein PMALA_067890 [Plasmodium malariae]|uniref:Uncharacterized protein n=1 Tax=Plasmodium malariae TaxID=5858 RepID=A0A1A8X3K8_PLAMA|nr:hypothetical protein PMALA_067890 [Plasmodium malariae]